VFRSIARGLLAKQEEEIDGVLGLIEVNQTLPGRRVRRLSEIDQGRAREHDEQPLKVDRPLGGGGRLPGLLAHAPRIRGRPAGRGR